MSHKEINRDIILKRLDELLPELKRDYKVKEIGLFGSVVRNENKTDSDIDFLVEFEKGADLFDLAALGIFLEDEFGSKIDVISKRAVRDELKNRIFSEVVYAHA
ncbi:nucleotidyltransferase family protein [Methanolobus bombayensis]|uniref:nucleotidyltransferase family protein n=1 Tax=Methanolobus bombayensis TaxID=38023 RepID=UPI001AE95FFE|nr:nucleotidyltransferase family protein [Methanolobus bombayensis]MBP1910646.1 putative nucleotidyltransferase [Methanolobus bombayensis]